MHYHLQFISALERLHTKVLNELKGNSFGPFHAVQAIAGTLTVWDLVQKGEYNCPPIPVPVPLVGVMKVVIQAFAVNSSALDVDSDDDFVHV